jgi:STE24 endopeptidase
MDAFEIEELERARRYHRPLYVAFGVETGLSALLLALLAFTRFGDALYRPLRELVWWGAAPAFAGIVVVLGTLVRTPLAFWRGYLRERRWGFSTQSAGGWAVDRLKGLGIGILLTAAVELALVGLARALPHAWPAAAAGAAAAAVVLVSFVAPVVLEPIFNRFRPLDDRALADELRALAERAGVPVRDVLIADASRRTTKLNAYVSGLARTRRVVLYDTLLERASPRQVRLIVAHELGHRRERHVLIGTLLAAAGAVAATAAVWGALGSAAADPRKLPVVLLVGLGFELAGLVPGSALSRRWERAADRCSLELTGDVDGFASVHRELARANLADLDPPRAVYVLLFSHPTPPERIAAARTWLQAAESARADPAVHESPKIPEGGRVRGR